MLIIEERVKIESAAGGPIEGTLSYREDTAPRARAVLSCPHPFLGGTADNPVVLALRDGFVAAGAVVLVWTYRATAGGATTRAAEGRADSAREAFWRDHRLEMGAGDRDDGETVRRWLERIPLCGAASRALVAGYSYGAILSMVLAEAGDALLLVAPPLRALPGAWLPPDRCRLTLLRSIDDLAVTEREEQEFLARHGVAVESVEVLEGTDHFFREALGIVQERARSWTEARLNAGR